MKPIHAQIIDTFQHGSRRVMVVTKPGSLEALARDGSTIQLPYKAGDAILGNEHDEVICGPVGVPGALDLAERILDGDQRAITDPQALHVLATAIVAFSIDAGSSRTPHAAAIQPATGASS